MAKVLAGSWREELPTVRVTPEEISEVAPLLLGSGAGALAWWRVRHVEHLPPTASAEFQQAYRFYSLRAAVHETHIGHVVPLLRAAGAEPMLIKGWSVARHYPDQALRPYGDLDILVHPDHYGAARAALYAPDSKWYSVDLHKGLDRLYLPARGRGRRGVEGLFDRSSLVRVGGTDVRVMGPEDHLRTLCVHLLRHGAWRPLWLCDVAAVMEGVSAAFDWDYCLCCKRHANWVSNVIGLAQRLLAADLVGVPVQARGRELPPWLAREVIKRWETPFASCQPMRHRPPMSKYLRDPQLALGDIASRWPNPIAATVNAGGTLNRLPRLPFQLFDCVKRVGRFLRHPRRVLQARLPAD